MSETANTPNATPGRPTPGTPPPAEAAPAFDPLRLCIYTTVALIAWLAGPFAVVGFAALGLAGYWKAHQAGLTRTKCYLRDVRLVLLYLTSIAAIAAFVAGKTLFGWFS